MAAATAESWQFSRVVAFGFYDGPESGLALLPDGRALRFDAIAESRSTMCRAYEFRQLDGRDVPVLLELLEAQLQGTPNSDKPFVLPDASGRWDPLDRAIESARAVSTYVGAGTSYLKKLRVVAVDEATLGRFKAGAAEEVFAAVHRFLKQASRTPAG